MLGGAEIAIIIGVGMLLIVPSQLPKLAESVYKAKQKISGKDLSDLVEGAVKLNAKTKRR